MHGQGCLIAQEIRWLVISSASKFWREELKTVNGT
jgi:hypothetical protein